MTHPMSFTVGTPPPSQSTFPLFFDQPLKIKTDDDVICRYDDSGEEERPPGDLSPPFSLDDEWMTVGKDPLHASQEGIALALKPLELQHDFRFTLHNAAACISLCSDPDAAVS